MKVLLDGFHLNGHTLGFRKDRILVQHDKQYDMKAQLISFHLNGQTLGCHPETQI